MSVYSWCTACDCRVTSAEGTVLCQNPSSHRAQGLVKHRADFHQAGYKTERTRVLFDTVKDAKAYQDKTRAEYRLKKRGIAEEGDPEPVPFEQVADEWWSRVVLGQNKIKDPNRSEKSRVNLWKEMYKGKPISLVTFDEIEEWVGDRQDAGKAVSTINRDLKPLRWILKYAVTKGYIKEDPLEKLEGVKGERIHDRWMSEQEVGALVQAALDLGDFDLADFIAVAVNTGFRLGNLERLTARDIGGGLLEARQTKSGNPYTVPISPDVEPILRRLVAKHPTGPLLPQRSQKLGDRFRAAAKKAGLYKDRQDNDRVTIHTLRHTFAVLYLKRGGDIYQLSKLMGHASVVITDKVYARYCPEEKLKEAAAISTPIPQLQPQLKLA